MNDIGVIVHSLKKYVKTGDKIMSESGDIANNIQATEALHNTYNVVANTRQSEGLNFEGIVTGERELPVTMTGTMGGPHSTFGS